MKQQTAVEWLIKEYSRFIDDSNVPFGVLEQAKEMEKGQIKDAFVNGFCNANDKEDKSLNADEIFYRTRYGGNKCQETK